MNSTDKLAELQTAYKNAEMAVTAAKNALARAEHHYIQNNHIVNDDGTTPESLWEIDDESALETHILLFISSANVRMIRCRLRLAKKKFYTARDNLVWYTATADD